MDTPASAQLDGSSEGPELPVPLDYTTLSVVDEKRIINSVAKHEHERMPCGHADGSYTVAGKKVSQAAAAKALKAMHPHLPLSITSWQISALGIQVNS